MRWNRLTTIALALFLVQSPLTRAAEGQRGAGSAPPRLRFIDGDVSFWRPGAEDWAPAQVNTPLAAGDSLYTGDGGNLEVQAGSSAFVRAGAGTDLSLTSVESDLQQYKLTTGHAAVDARRLPRGQAIEVDTPNGALTIDHAGYYRVDVDDEGSTYTARRGGTATLVPANGDATDVEADKQVVVKGTDTPEVASNAAPEPDDWDRWNLDRGEHASQPTRSATYVPPDVSGGDDLDEYGDWRETPRYGHVWVPHATPADWAPYSTGRWVWDPYYGWTWVDDAPWGWAPYHYGRWVYADGFWGWAPGPVVVAPVYSPALVAFFGGPHVTVAVGAPFPFVSWVALGWGEPLIPWWGPVGFVGHCWWGGWGGPHVVNNVVIQKNVYVNVRNVTVFRNQTVNHAVMAVHRDRFGQGRVEHVRLTRDDAARLRPVRGPLAVKPTAASLVPREGHARRPPASAQARPVVATRPPQDPSRRLRAAGVNAPEHAAPPPRLVQAPRAHGGVGRATVRQRQAPPPHPGMANRRGGEAPSQPLPPGHAHTGRPEGRPSGERGGQRQPEGASPPQHERRGGDEAPHRAAPARPAPPYPSAERGNRRPSGHGSGGSHEGGAPREGGGSRPAPRHGPHEGGPGGRPATSSGPDRPPFAGAPRPYSGAPHGGHERGGRRAHPA